MSRPGPPPLIGITTYRQTTAWWAWQRDAALVPGTYLDLVVAAGGQPVLIPPGGGTREGGLTDRGGEEGDDDPSAGPASLLALLDGLLLIGGGDVASGRYGQPEDPRNGGTNERRDALELGLAAEALRLDLPLLAICRGHQLLNVLLGGDLVQHLPDVLGTEDHQPRPGGFSPISVATEPGTTVCAMVGERLDVLCSHHQAVGTLGRGVVVAARSADGVVEAVELPAHRFAVGLQWHPEESGDVRPFRALVDAARSARPCRVAAQSGSPT
jgi:gamma-glutamyl-gamma-aminobutyrate hydrolase PuuD